MEFLRHLRTRFRLYVHRVRRFVLHNILHADDPPHRLALGVAIGVFVAFTPTIGFQMMIAVFLAWLLRANKVVGLPVVWISNPATLVPIYYWCYCVGRWILGQQHVGEGWWQRFSQHPPGWGPAFCAYWARLMEIAAPLSVGCVVVGLLLAYPTYYVLFHAICKYRMRRWGQLVPPTQQKHGGKRW